MKVFKYTAPTWAEADIWYSHELQWHMVLSAFEGHVDEMETGEKLTFNVELLEITQQQWDNIQDEDNSYNE